MSLFKAQAHMRELRQRLSLSIPAATFVDDLDANSMPILVVSHASEKQFIKIETLDNAGRVDALGLPQRVYSPHKCSLIREATATPPADILGREIVSAAIAKLGMEIDIYEGTGVKTAANYAAAEALAPTVTVKIRSDEINPLTQSQ